ncbi:hypothetical protein [Burkholderia ubonensis]|uniref:hypothetical protein n=1 Tax=Burkholderia ubonensis TaxID=101571 RepID=UPI000B0CA57D|nr:hypothetical protein [Burkholderia ubonensis]
MNFGVTGTTSSAIGQGAQAGTANQSHSPAAHPSTFRTMPDILEPLKPTSHLFSGARVIQRQAAEHGAVVSENSVARVGGELGADANLCYPNISSCLTVTGLSRQGSLRGAHLATPFGLKNDDMATLAKAIGAAGCDKFVVAGPIKDIKARTDEGECNSRKEIEAQLKAFSSDAEVRFLDTSKRPAPYNIYVQRERQASGETLKLHIVDQSAARGVAGVVTAPVPNDASLPPNAEAIPDKQVVQREASWWKRA